jgi:predicted dinucleotide-binding enzyme
MKVAIIGIGNVGGAIARGLSGKGHPLTLGAREAAKAADLAARTGAAVRPPAAAAAAADVVVLALPWAAAEAAVAGLGSLAGKVVIDCMNPLGPTPSGIGLTVGFTTSGAEQVAAWLPGARVVKTLNQVGAEIMADAARLPRRPVQFVAGDDTDAKTDASRLLTDLGFEPMDAGDLTKARLLEPLAMVWINQALARGEGRNWALSVVRGPGG